MKLTFVLGVGALAIGALFFYQGWQASNDNSAHAPHAARTNPAPVSAVTSPLSAVSTAAARPAPAAPRFHLAPPQKQGAPSLHEPALAQFTQWIARYQAAAPTARASLEAEGLKLARARRTALADLIQVDPQRALELALPGGLRVVLPQSIQALLEESVNARGDYEVLCAYPLPGGEHVDLVRAATAGGDKFRVFTFGAGLEYVTRPKVPLNGIAVPVATASRSPADPAGVNASKLLALDPCPGRLVDPAEVFAAQDNPAAELRCLATGQPWSITGSPTALQYGGDVYPFSRVALAEEWVTAATLAENLDQPQPPTNLPTAESSYTEGRKRFLLMRVDFPDFATDVFPTNSAVQHMVDMSNFLAQISYFKHIIAPVGEGTDITPVMRMSQNTAAYDNAGLSKLYPEARDVARTNFGYDLNQYDFCFVCTGSRPAYSYAGLGWVGGVGYHLANSYFNVRTSAHEFGHNLGLGHANWWNTGDQTTIGPGSSDEYGDDYDTMGISGGGRYHFSSTFKANLGWIPSVDAPTISSSGLFRLYAHDIATAPVGLRCLRLNRPGGDPYGLEFRQLWTDKKAMMNGVNFRWARGSSILLDMNPGSSPGKDDHSLTIGRTFSDTNLNYHFTPIGKGHTYPESMDIVINIGSFPGNQPPSATVGASPETASPNQAVTFSAAATDPNGDALAYFWDFGDGDYSVDNRAVTTHSYGSTGEYLAQCTVSDMKGGTARRSVVVRVGNPATYSISGRVLGTNNLPVTGVRISVDSSHYAFTDTDGTYTITRLSAGSYGLTAVEPVTGSLNFLEPFFSNPVTVGPQDFVGADFIATRGTFNPYVSIVASGAVWRYQDDGSDQGTNWYRVSFDDSGWSNGAAILGYGDVDANTPLSFGASSANKHITYYFRRSFTVENPSLFSSLHLNVLRDDGVVVYLNGAEAFRDNMPAGAITYTTLASSRIDPEVASASLAASLLRAGTNYLAAEVHQVAADSSDIAFDLELNGLSASAGYGLSLVYLSSPKANQVFSHPTSIPLAANARSGSGPVSLVEFYAGANEIGEDNLSPFSLTWSNAPLGQHLLRVVATVGGGLRVTSAPVAVSVVIPPDPPVALSLIPTGSVWRYLAGATAAPANWTAGDFNDASWPSGAAELGNGDATDGRPEATLIDLGPSNNRHRTIYFRRAFLCNDPSAITNLTLQLKRDDGAVVYLNGQEILRDNLPAGTITYSTLATNATDDGASFLAFTVSPARLIPGTNVVAVEVHQGSATSSDLSFDLGLDALASADRPRGIWLVSPANASRMQLPDNVLLSAQVVAGGTLGVSQVEFFDRDTSVGVVTAAPYSLLWNDPPAGGRRLVAVATDTVGGSITSAPVVFSVLAPPAGTALISLGEVWKYLDDGSNQGSNWTARSFDDRAWPAGPARLGYGNDGEATTVSYGTNKSTRHITTYFRRAFTAPSPAAYASLLLRLVRDDGAVVYLNGVEVFRNNLADSLISFNSLANAALGGADETAVIETSLPASLLVAGTNVVAVEIHQAAITSSDLGFDLALTGQALPGAGQKIYLTSPAQGTHYSAPAAVALSAFVSPSSNTIARVEYYAGQTKVGQSAVQPFSAVWSNPALGEHTLTAVAFDASGALMTSAPIAMVVGNPPAPIAPVYETLIPARSTWKFWDNVAAVGAGWAQTNFNDGAWPAGLAPLGWGYDGERTELTDGRVTHYFRRWFTVTNPALLTELVFQLLRDDGAVVYLNGREVFRSNMPDGTIGPATLASSTVNTPDESTYLEFTVPTPGSGLLAGSNLVAVELHQSSATSSDAGFDLQLLAFGTTEGRVYLATPAPGASFPSSASIDLQAFPWAPVGASVRQVEFFANGTKLGESLGPAYRFTWKYPPNGSYTVIARMTDSRGNVLDSVPVSVTIEIQRVSITLIASNSVWKYLDNGTDQGTQWAQAAFNDSLWPAGVARFGYGNDGEVTPLQATRADSSGITTYYFRQTFETPPGIVYTNLSFRLARDDGAVVWFNGQPLYRNNLPTTGAITYSTSASAAASGANEQTFFATTIPATNLLAGVNLVAVEIHQYVTTPPSSDVGFNFELVGQGYVDEAYVPTLSIAESEGSLELSWPSTAVGWELFGAPNLAAPPSRWAREVTPPIHVGGREVVTLPLGGTNQFFRLARP